MRKKETMLKIMFFAISLVFLLHARLPLVAKEETISEGLVFEKGRFIDPPYTVTTARYDSSYEVAINGLVIDRIRDCPSRGPVVFTHPGPYSVPEGVNGLRGSNFPLYCSQLFNYLEQEYGTKEARERIIDLLRSSALVTSIEILDDGANISDKYNHKYFIAFYNREVKVDYDSKELAEKTASAYRRYLSDGGAILMFSNGDMFVPASRVVEIIAAAIKVYESKLSEYEQIQALKELFNDRLMAEEFHRNFRSSETLRKRLSGY